MTVKYVHVSEEDAGQRLDNYLLKYFKGVPKSHIYRIIRKGEVRVNMKRTDVKYRLLIDDEVRIPPLRIGEKCEQKPRQSDLASLRDLYLYEDNNMIIINKPSGMAVHGGSGIQFGAIELLRAERKDLRYIELVHRLDRDTSGCLVLAKKRSSLRYLHEQLRERLVDKTYWALVKGVWPDDGCLVDAPLQKFTLSSGERIVKVLDSGKEAQTRFKPLQRFAKATLMQVTLLTGRMHQIRVHAAHMGCPVVGDEKYGDKDFNREMAAEGCDRLFLHAKTLALMPKDGEKKLIIHANLETKLDDFLKKL